MGRQNSFSINKLITTVYRKKKVMVGPPYFYLRLQRVNKDLLTLPRHSLTGRSLVFPIKSTLLYYSSSAFLTKSD